MKPSLIERNFSFMPTEENVFNTSPSDHPDFFRQLLESVNEMVLVIEFANWQIRYANKGFATLLELPREKLHEPEFSWLDYVHVDDRDWLIKQLQRLVSHSGALEISCRFRVVQNGRIHLLAGRLIKSDTSQVISEQIIIVLQDNTRLVEKLKETKAIYDSLINNLPINVFRKNLSGELVFVNHKYCEELGRSAEEVIGLTDFDLFDRALAEKYIHDDQEILKKVCRSIRWKSIRAKTKCLSLKSGKLRLSISTEKRLGFKGMFWDVTDRVVSEEALRKAKRNRRNGQQNQK